jgi:hypothetical protein
VESSAELEARLLTLARALGLTLGDDAVRRVAATMADALSAVRAAARALDQEAPPAMRPSLDEPRPPSA